MNDKFINHKAIALKDDSMSYIYFKEMNKIKNDILMNRRKINNMISLQKYN